MVRITTAAYYNSFYCVSIGFSSTFKNPVWIKFMYVKEWSIFYRQELSFNCKQTIHVQPAIF